MRMRLVHKSVAFLLVTALSGCTDIFSPGCTLELGIEITPVEATIQVGETVRPKLELSSCGGREVLIAQWHLFAESGVAVEIGADKRSFTGVQAGHSLLAVRDERYGVVGQIRVVVSAD